MIRCPDCRRSVHRFCGTTYGKDEEGFEQHIWCSSLEQCQMNISAGAAADAALKLHQKRKLSPIKRARIWEMHQKNPKLTQMKLAEKARKEFHLDKLTQATIISFLKEYRVNNMVKAGNLTMQQCHQIHHSFWDTKSGCFSKDSRASFAFIVGTQRFRS